MKKNPRLRFTDAELDPRLKEHVRRAEKAAAKADRAQSKLPKARKKTKRRMIEQARKAGKTAKGGKGKAASRLMFEEDRPAPPSKLEHTVRAAPVLAAEGAIHREIGKAGEDNAGVESAHALVLTAEGSGRVVESAYRAHKLKPYRAAARAEKQLEKANINALYQKSLRDDPQLSSNPISRWRQKQAIKKEYAAAKRAGQTTVSAEKLVKDSAGAARQAAERGQKAAAFLRRNWKGVGVALGLFLVIGLLLNSMSSCTAFLEAGLSSLGGSTYPCQDADMLGAEAAYAGMEAELQSYLDTYESTHDYDEYHFDLDEIGHDPYVLISILTAYHQGEWTLAQVQGTLEMLFGRQYTLTENVVVETRYRTETSTWTDEEGNTHTDTYQVPYDYYICYVTLENFDLSHLPVYIMGEDQVSMYAVYMATLGNRPDLFPQGEYPNASQREDYMDYDVPPEALADEQFAAMLAEAEKYLGYPYVWGGSNPSTSFDCSGFVSWVINHSGWNVGRLGAQGLCNICTPVSTADARPGDLVFFKYTYDAPNPDGVTHCGIYVGNGMMIHCGSPISYANLNTNYWQSHFYDHSFPLRVKAPKGMKHRCLQHSIL